jgi:urea transport system permease protein
MDEKNHHLHKPVFIGEIKADGQFNVVWKTPPVPRSRPKPWSPFITDSASFDWQRQAKADDAVKVSGGRVFIVRDGKGVDPLTGLGIAVPADAEDVVNNNRMRGELDNALAALKLFSKDDKLRLQGVKALLKEPDEARLPLVEKALAAEKNETIRTQLELARAAALLGSSDKDRRLEAARAMGQSKTPETKLLLNERMKAEADPAVKAQLEASLRAIEGALAWGDKLGALFSGISLGSILLLVALGLAITYGLMGVINMAHGELMMIGAYATYVVQGLFQRTCPGAFDWYLLAAVPVAFLASALVGAALERSVIRFLYGRPAGDAAGHLGHQPDADAGGAQPVRRAERGGGEPVVDERRRAGAANLTSALQPHRHHRLCRCRAGGRGLLIGKTRLGLFVRGVTQNRRWPSCMGVNTARIDTYAFALGSGIAGLAGCALSQVGNVGPDLGQSYIVDASWWWCWAAWASWPARCTRRWAWAS